MDKEGNIAVGYTRTGDFEPHYPSIYYSGRMASDPLGTMPHYDNLIWDAATSKTDNERWGDYSGIGVDPADGCTFWYTTEYGGSGQSRILRIDGAVVTGEDHAPVPLLGVMTLDTVLVENGLDVTRIVNDVRDPRHGRNPAGSTLHRLELSGPHRVWGGPPVPVTADAAGLLAGHD